MPKDAKTPPHFYDAWKAIETYRKDHAAAVDTMGVHTAANHSAPKEEQDFQTLFSLMLSSQTKDSSLSHQSYCRGNIYAV